MAVVEKIAEGSAARGDHNSQAAAGGRRNFLKLGAIEADREEHRKTLFWRSQAVGRCVGTATFIGATAVLLIAALLMTETFGAYLRDKWTSVFVTFVIFFALVWGATKHNFRDFSVGFTLKHYE